MQQAVRYKLETVPIYTGVRGYAQISENIQCSKKTWPHFRW